MQHVDPVCGMQVNENEAAGKSQHGGQTYHFCSTECKNTFDKNPAEYTTTKHAEGQEHQGAGKHAGGKQAGKQAGSNQPGQMQGQTGQSHTGRETGANPQGGIGRRHEEGQSTETERDKRDSKGRKSA